MRVRVAPRGIVEWGLIFALLVLILSEVAAFQMGLGPYASVVSLGYVLALAAGYVLYRYDKKAADARQRRNGILAGVDIFKDLSGEEIDTVASQGRQLSVEPGTVLGRSGELGSHLYIIVDGNVQLSASSAVGEITVRVAGPNEAFPLASLIGSGELITTAKAMTPVQLLAIPRSDLLALWREDPDLGMRMSASVAGVLADRYRTTLAHLSASAEQALRSVGFWANV